MNGNRGISLLADLDQWARCHHVRTALLPSGGVQLNWTEEPPPDGKGAGARTPAGLGFDRWGHAYVAHPLDGRLSVHQIDAVSEPAEPKGTARCQGALSCPRGLAVDDQQRLCIAESGDGHVYVVDLWADRLLRRVPVRTPSHPRTRPVDAAPYQSGAAVLLQRPVGVLLVDGRRRPRPVPGPCRPRCGGGLEPARIASGPAGRLLVLWCGPAAEPPEVGSRRGLVAALDGTVIVDVDDATDIEFTGDGLLVVARGPGRSFRRFQLDGQQWLELEPVAAPHYDGGAIAAAPDGGVAYTSDRGFGWAGGTRARHATDGMVVTYRLKSDEYRTRWGRLFLDACLPPGTSVLVQFLTTDDDDADDPIRPQPAQRGHQVIRRPDLTPPFPSQADLDAADRPFRLHRRPSGREQPWAQIPVEDTFETYEAPVKAPPGRYLWVVLKLAGTGQATPTIRSLRVERPGHQLLGQLPRSWSRDDADAAFMYRFLALLEAPLHELDQRAAQRHVLLDPAAAPQEALAWLASFAGLVTDRRWPEAGRRRLISEAYQLFRRRGTLAALRRILELYLDYPPVLVEQWQLRGLGGAVLGTAPDNPVTAVLGATIRAGGLTQVTPAPGGGLVPDAFSTAAHRFSVLIPSDLSAEQLDVVRSILDVHRPAHTIVEVCELGFGMRVGRRLHLGLTSIVGPDVGWGPAIVGQMAIGGDAAVGIAASGSRVGTDAKVGAVRVG